MGGFKKGEPHGGNENEIRSFFEEQGNYPAKWQS
jgi:hypothetical protein